MGLHPPFDPSLGKERVSFQAAHFAINVWDHGFMRRKSCAFLPPGRPSRVTPPWGGAPSLQGPWRGLPPALLPDRLVRPPTRLLSVLVLPPTKEQSRRPCSLCLPHPKGDASSSCPCGERTRSAWGTWEDSVCPRIFSGCLCLQVSWQSDVGVRRGAWGQRWPLGLEEPP